MTKIEQEIAAEEMRLLRDDFARRVAAMAASAEDWEKSGHTDLSKLWAGLHHVKDALPPWLFSGLLEMLMKQVRPTLHPKPPCVDEVRWGYVRYLRDYKGLKWNDAYERASELLKRTSAKGSADAMHTSYKVWNKNLPPEQRRPRTYQRAIGRKYI
jgi:hypothetical protein